MMNEKLKDYIESLNRKYEKNDVMKKIIYVEKDNRDKCSMYPTIEGGNNK